MATPKLGKESEKTSEDEGSTSTLRAVPVSKSDPFVDPRRGQERRQQQVKGIFKSRRQERRKLGYTQGGVWWLSRNYTDDQ